MKTYPLLFITSLLIASCNTNRNTFDATGTFEATEVIVSSETNGRILQLSPEEGDILSEGQKVGYVDSTQLYLTSLQIKESRKAVLASRPDIKTQIEATQKEIESTRIDQKRTENLVKGGVATQKQLDDVNAKLAVLDARLVAQKNSLQTNTAALNEQSSALQAQLAVISDQLKRCTIINPIKGTVLSKYARANEITGAGKPLYKIADLETLTLRAYVSGDQLPQLKLGQIVDVSVDADKDHYKTYKGYVTWISDKAEFTPKTIQTKDERANLVYAIKI
ncbi:MAG: HlyD family efflux transporter periplasmic adaptor subunit, partial [Bacteroidetes bacterium]|nr:HlyD family efflux transporter periplasmic adaptor subunit [Bacteroidota bacterium]